MSLPKAILVLLDKTEQGDSPEEMELRGAGFATATIFWSEIDQHPNGWTQLAEILATKGLSALIFAGSPEHFNEDLISRISLFQLYAAKNEQLRICFLLSEPDQHTIDNMCDALPPLLESVRIYLKGQKFGASLMASRFKNVEKPQLPFYLTAHLSPLVGVWLEVGPNEQSWPGFFLATVGSEIDALGVGERGQLPKKCTLEYPVMNIEGDLAGQKWNGCAAKNQLQTTSSAYIRLTRPPHKLLIGPYPEESEDDAYVIVFV